MCVYENDNNSTIFCPSEMFKVRIFTNEDCLEFENEDEDVCDAYILEQLEKLIDLDISIDYTEHLMCGACIPATIPTIKKDLTDG